MSESVLFVDDEQSVLDAIQRTLRKQIDIKTANGAAEGLRMLRELGHFALVISDMRMPIMSGAQFLAKVREEEPDCVRMILSGHSDLQVDQHCRRGRCGGAVSRPSLHVTTHCTQRVYS